MDNFVTFLEKRRARQRIFCKQHNIAVHISFSSYSIVKEPRLNHTQQSTQLTLHKAT